MLIVDSQVHIWGADSVTRPWPKGHPVRAHRAIPLDQEDLLREMNSAGVDRAVLVPPSWEGYRHDVVLAACRTYPKRFAAMGRIHPDPSISRRLLPAWKRQSGMLGLRFGSQSPSLRELLEEGRLDWLWPEAEKHDLPICLLARHSAAKFVDSVASRYPALKLVIDHAGLVGGKDKTAFAEFDEFLKLARRPNVAVKASCFPLFTDDVYPYKSVHAYLRSIYDRFGPKRMFWGSDLTRLPCAYIKGVTLFTENLPWLTGEDLEWVMGRGICEWLRWKD